MVFSYGASLWRLGISRLDRAGEARLVGSTVAEGGSDRVHRLVDAAAGYQSAEAETGSRGRWLLIP